MKTQAGFGAITALVILVLLGGLAAAITALTTGQHLASALDIQAARAWQVARAGTEWGLYQAIQNTRCDGPTTLDLSSNPGYEGFRVTVSCTAQSYPVNGLAVPFYEIRAVACNAASCPSGSAVTLTTYVERTRVATAY